VKGKAAELLPDQKPKQRRVQLNNLDDARRESSYIYRAMVNGRLSLEAGDILSRVVGRHREIVAAIDQAQQLSTLIEQLKNLRGEAAIGFDPDLLEPET
jgi:Ni,Fe-hydrogenase III large subunit